MDLQRFKARDGETSRTSLAEMYRLKVQMKRVQKWRLGDQRFGNWGYRYRALVSGVRCVCGQEFDDLKWLS